MNPRMDTAFRVRYYQANFYSQGRTRHAVSLRMLMKTVGNSLDCSADLQPSYDFLGTVKTRRVDYGNKELQNTFQ